ncbi:MAG: ATP-dependent DNA helicase RecG [Chloroflexota bacterium]|nr:ATP-dependent DNA helicase RecG [Dehalococcoidia bacterium]MDW8254112.1 ATP-dependent DNA helicase RecG [Chloroflexota bacterium]
MTIASPTDVLRQILEILERERREGCRNRLVLGGLDRYLAVWLPRLARSLPPRAQEDIAEFPFRAYAETPPAERPQWLTEVAAWLRETAQPRAAPPPRPRAARAARAMPPPSDSITLETPISALRGFDRRVIPAFRRLGVETVRDVLLFFPHRHLDRRAVVPIRDLSLGTDATILVTIWELAERVIGPGRQLVEATVSDASGTLRARWFNQPWVARTVRPGSRWLLSGRVESFKGRLELTVDDYEPFDEEGDRTHAGRLVPVYPLTEGIAQRTVRRLVKSVVERYAALLPEPLPAEIRRQARLMDRIPAVRAMHYPETPTELADAKRRLAFDELFILQLGLQRAKAEWQQAGYAEPIIVPPAQIDQWTNRLPFTLTTAQRRALQEILADLARDRPMARLLQGDVGSGKTVVAAIALAAAVTAGGQGALLAPTEILANQHRASLGRLFSLLLPQARVEVLTGAVQGKKRQRLLDDVAAGEVALLVGTHAVIQEQVTFKRLLLGVIDEQHRFGVAQRAALRHKGVSGQRHPHMLVMTATPIPRTLALTLYGDLDLSVLDELPPGRQPIRTRLVPPEKRERAYQFVREQVRLGRQAYVICPLIEESEKIEAKAATAEFDRLRHIFPDLRLGLLHGRMKPKEKDAVMIAFRDGAIDVLVSTAVVEVGIDVPNATVMLIEGAERFGLAQLHQFRGRVGRGQDQSYCLLLTDSAQESERLRIVEQTNDGFALAEEDLRLRGPGEFFGVRQSGLPELKVARLSDAELMDLAREQAERIIATDPGLEAPQHQLLRAEFQRIWIEGTSGDRS